MYAYYYILNFIFFLPKKANVFAASGDTLKNSVKALIPAYIRKNNEIMLHIKQLYKCLIYNYIDFNKSNEHENGFTNLRYMVAHEMP